MGDKASVLLLILFAVWSVRQTIMVGLLRADIRELQAKLRQTGDPTAVATVSLQALTLRDDVVTALLVAQEHRLRQGQERVH